MGLKPLKKKNNMGQCGKCIENNWTFQFSDGVVTATCKYCENQVQFESRKMKKRKAHGPKQYSPKKLAPVSLHHRHVPSTLPVNRPAHIMPWD
jgi:hypothetical protein